MGKRIAAEKTDEAGLSWLGYGGSKGVKLYEIWLILAIHYPTLYRLASAFKKLIDWL